MAVLTGSKYSCVCVCVCVCVCWSVDLCGFTCVVCVYVSPVYSVYRKRISLLRAMGSCGVLCCNGTAVRRLLSLPFNLICLLVAFGSVLDIGAEIECRLHIL